MPFLVHPDTDFQSLDAGSPTDESWLELPLKSDRPIPVRCAVCHTVPPTPHNDSPGEIGHSPNICYVLSLIHNTILRGFHHYSSLARDGEGNCRRRNNLCVLDPSNHYNRKGHLTSYPTSDTIKRRIRHSQSVSTPLNTSSSRGQISLSVATATQNIRGHYRHLAG